MPYKRYESACIERVVLKDSNSLDIAMDEATLYRLRAWFNSLLLYLLGCLNAIAIRLGEASVEESSVSSRSVHQRIGCYVGNELGWLARIVRSVANSNLWVQTRSAFLSVTI